MKKYIVTYLSKKENWDDIDIYIHRSRLIIGFVLGFITGLPAGLIILLLYATK